MSKPSLVAQHRRQVMLGYDFKAWVGLVEGFFESSLCDHTQFAPKTHSNIFVSKLTKEGFFGMISSLYWGAAGFCCEGVSEIMFNKDGVLYSFGKGLHQEDHDLFFDENNLRILAKYDVHSQASLDCLVKTNEAMKDLSLQGTKVELKNTYIKNSFWKNFDDHYLDIYFSDLVEKDITVVRSFWAYFDNLVLQQDLKENIARKESMPFLKKIM